MEVLKIIQGATVLLMLIAFLASPFLIARDAQIKFGYAFFGGDIKYVWVVSGVALWIAHFWIVLAEKYNGAYTEKYAWGLMAFGIAGFGCVLYKNIIGTNLTYGLASSVVLIPALMALSSAVVPALIFLKFISISTSGSSVREKSFDDGSDARYPPGTHLPIGSTGLVMGKTRR